MLALPARVAELEEENRQLRKRIADLEGKPLLAAARRVFGASTKQAGLIVLLARRGEVSRAMCLDALYNDRQYAALEDPHKAISCVMKYVRRRLDTVAIKVSTVYGEGWSLTEEAQLKLRKLLEASS